MRIDTFEYDSSVIISNLISKRGRIMDSVIAGIKPNTIANWSFSDFLYFSTITQATVGYGDMLPNSTMIRMIVTIQTLLGVLLSVILIAYSFNAFFGERRLNK
jgi:voltage-gated potassium channel